MKAAVVASVLALAGSSFAAPAPLEKKDVKVVYETVVNTVYYTPGVTRPTQRPHYHWSHHSAQVTPTPSAAPQPAPTSAAEEVQPTSEAPAAPAPSSEAPVASSVVVAPSSSAAAAAEPSSTGYMAVVDEWRSKLGLSALTHNAKLEANALDTVKSSNGQMVHKLNPGSMGQVLAPGSADDFEHVFVGGWLCEKPDMAGLDGICSTESQGWTYNGQIGHAEILTSPDYSGIGCALYAGIWACDLGSADLS